MKPNKTGLERILNAFKYSRDGFVAAFKSEEAFRQDVLLCSVLFFIAILLDISFIEKLFLFSSLFLVIISELVNTTIEVIIDRISDDIHPLSKIAKDIGSCIVLVSFMYLILVWIIILYENFL
ncbi:MAG: diacylglycerol kinase [Rickettsiales bacterium]|nr:diacylglycerol kinase [Rickettsiales bacterium]